MAKHKRMDQIKNILRNYLVSGTIKATARQLKVSKNTVREYIRRAEAYSTDLTVVLELDEEAVYSAQTIPPILLQTIPPQRACQRACKNRLRIG